MIEDIPSRPIHGGQLRAIAERFGVVESKLLDFSANINPDGPPSAVLSTLRASLEDISTITSYPDLEQIDLKRSIARYAGVASQNVAVSNGFVPLLEAALRALPIKSCLVPVPAFVEYRNALERARIEVIPHVLSPEDEFSYDPDRLVSGRHDAILLANPQNPSGVACPRDVVEKIVGNAAERNVYILLDEAFIDYAPELSVTDLVELFPNLIVFRSVTKFHGMPGLRVAYAVANVSTTRALSESLPPWPITTLASLAVKAGLEDEAYASQTRALNEQRRALLQAGIDALGVHTYPSAANFLLMRLPEFIDAEAFWLRILREHHIVLRSCFNYEALSAGHLRTAVRGEEDNCRLIQAMQYELGRFSAALK
jgi:threonine-phosphate decarboxylase